MEKINKKYLGGTVYQGEADNDILTFEFRHNKPDIPSVTLRFTKWSNNENLAIKLHSSYELNELPNGNFEIILDKTHPSYSKFSSLGIELVSLNEHEMEIECGFKGKYNLKRVK